MSTATRRGARAVGIACAGAFVVLVALRLLFPAESLFPPYHPAYERMIAAVLLSFGLGLALALRDPVRNAGVYAVVGLSTGFLLGANVYALAVDGADAARWIAQAPLLAAIALALVVTYTRLRRPHPVVVRIVVAAVVMLPVALFVYDAAFRAQTVR